MNWERSLLRFQSDSGPLCELVPIREFIDEHTFLTTQGYVGVAVSIQPAAYECLTPEEMAGIAHRFQAVLKNFAPEIRVYQYALKRSDPHLAVSEQGERAAFLAGRKQALYSLEFFLVLVYEVKLDAAHILPERAAAMKEAQIRLAAHYLNTSANGFIEGIGLDIHARKLGKQESFRFFRRLLNYWRPVADGRQMEADSDVAWQLADSSVDGADILRVGRHYVRVFTLKDLPHGSGDNEEDGGTDEHHLGTLYQIPCNCVVVTEWKPVQVHRLKRSFRRSKRHANWTMSSTTNYIGKNPPRADEIIIDGEKLYDKKELTEAQHDARKQGLQFGDWSLTIILYDEDPARLRTAGQRAAEALLTSGGAVTEQTGKAALLAWLAAIPGNSRFSVRSQRISNLNYADLSFLFSVHTGSARNEYLNAECLTVLETRLETPYYLNLHHGELGHTLITGVQRSGKTFLLAHLILQYLKYRPYIAIFDIENSFRHLTEWCGGAYLEVGRRDGGTRINPFSRYPTEKHVAHLFSLIRLLLESDGGARLAHDDVMTIHQQIREVYRLPLHRRRLRDLALPKHLSDRLDRWVHRVTYRGEIAGPYAHLFDNEIDTLTASQFQAFNFPDMKADPEALEALIFYVLHMVSQSVEADDAQPALVALDEGWQFLRHPETRAYIEASMKRWPKRNGVMVLATHSLYDLRDASVRAIIESCVTKIHGSNPGIDEPAWQDAFHLKPTETALIRTLIGQREFLVQGSGVVALHVSERDRWLFSNSAHMNKRRDEVIAQHGLADGLTVLAGER